MRAMIIVVASVLLTACATPEQRAAYHASEVDSLVQEYGAACDKLGFNRNSDQWRNCILQLSTKDDLARYSGGFYGGRGRWMW
jgi:hypothetical protein